MIFMNKSCVSTRQSTSKILFNKFFYEERECLLQTNVKGDNGDGIFHSKHEYYTFADFTTDKDCIKSTKIDMEKYCLNKVKYEPIFQLTNFTSPICGTGSTVFISLNYAIYQPYII